MQNITIKNIGKKVLKLEVEALKKLEKSINDSFSKIIKLIVTCKNGKNIGYKHIRLNDIEVRLKPVLPSYRVFNDDSDKSRTNRSKSTFKLK